MELHTKDIDSGTWKFPPIGYYLGAVIIIGANGWSLSDTLGRQLSATAQLVLSLLQICGLLWLGLRLLQRGHARVHGGLLCTLAVCIVPVSIHAIERLTGLWPQTNLGSYAAYHREARTSWILMELALIAASSVALHRIRFPFLTFPLTLGLWMLAQDLVALALGQDNLSWEQALQVSMTFGVVLLGISRFADRRGWADYGFWLDLFGLLSFWVALSLGDGENERNRLIYFTLNLGLIALAFVIRRRAFGVFGSLGACGYLVYLCYRLTDNPAIFPFALSALGLGLIGLAGWWQRQERLKTNTAPSHPTAAVATVDQPSCATVPGP